MNIPFFSLKHQPIVWILLILAVVSGISSYMTISQREDPEFKISIALVVTIWPGASAEKVESLVTKKIEEKLEEISVSEEIKSTTRENLSVIFFKVNYDCDTDMAWQKLRNKIEEVRGELPSSIIGPDVIDDFGDVTSMIYSLSSKSAQPKELKKWSKLLRSAVQKAPSVGKVNLIGEQQEAIYIEGPLSSFSMYNFSPLVAARFLDYQNVNMPGGYVRSDDRKYRLEVSGSFALDEQLENAILDVSKETGMALKVKDVFSVRRTYKEPPLDYMKTDGLVSVGLDIRMRKGRNLVKMGEEVRTIAEEFSKRLPENIQLKLVHDQPRQIATFIGTFMNNLFEGLGIVVLVMLVSMGLRSAGLIAISLPLSIILTFAVMPIFGTDLETVSIAAFIIALGMLVDNAIIITDNIDVHLRKNPNRFEAVWQGAHELAVPALTGTLATIFAFLPLLLMSEEIGDYIRALPVVVSSSLLASLLLALTFTPILALLFLRPKTAKKGKSADRENAFARKYRRMMGWCLSHRRAMFMIVLGVFVGSLFLLRYVGFAFFPEAERDQFTIDVWLPEGVSIAHTENVVGQVESILDSEEHVTNYLSYVGKGGPRFYISIKPVFNTSNYAQIVVSTDDPKITRPLTHRLNDVFEREIAGARITANCLLMGVPVEAPIVIEITGPDLKESNKISQRIQKLIKGIPGTLHVRDNLGRDVPSIKIDVDSEAAAMSGITNTEVAVSLLTAYEGLPVTRFREGEEEVPVYMRLIESERNMGNTFDALTVPSQATGAKVPLPAIADINVEWSPGVIKRVDTHRTINALADVRGRLASEIMNDLKPLLAQVELPKGYSIGIGGEEKERAESFGELGMIFVLIIALIMLMLVIQFNSIKRSLVILASIPLAFVGAVFGLFVSGSPFAFMPFLGVVSLAGMVIKNAVVWMEFVDKSVEDGLPLSEAIIEAGRMRLRPILLTAATTIGGLIPLAMFGGVLWEGMAYAMIFGLALATVLTLVVVPVFYYSVFRKQSEAGDSGKVAVSQSE